MHYDFNDDKSFDEWFRNGDPILGMVDIFWILWNKISVSSTFEAFNFLKNKSLGKIIQTEYP